jgi:hypothetical protein
MPRMARNVSSAAEKLCSCGSWMNHWAKVSGKKKPTVCMAASCYGTNPAGALVAFADAASEYFVVPLCSKHSRGELEFAVLDDSWVSANKALTCEKPR